MLSTHLWEVNWIEQDRIAMREDGRGLGVSHSPAGALCSSDSGRLTQAMGFCLPFSSETVCFSHPLGSGVFLFMLLYLKPSPLSLSPQPVSFPLLSDTISLFKRGHYSCHRQGSTSTSLYPTFILGFQQYPLVISRLARPLLQ